MYNNHQQQPNMNNNNKNPKKQRQFTVQEKLCLVRNIQKRVESDSISCRQACITVNIHHKQYIQWKMQLAPMLNARNIKAKSLCNGWPSILNPVKEDLLRFIFELREQGMGVSTTMVLFKAAALSRDFQDKSRAASQMFCHKPSTCTLDSYP